MKIKRSVITVLLCMVVCMVIGWMVCDRQMIQIDSDYITSEYDLQEFEIVDIEQTAEGLKIGKDPQIIMPDICTYVKTICLEGMQITEEVQVFFTETRKECNSFHSDDKEWNILVVG